ncbi:MAG: glycosyltransferase family 4 protein [Pseudomonadales bacterium]|nr:glycosyltransferase family 4 protein [Pseudomonadales bacterium]
MQEFQSLYSAFDTFPAPKGAAIHIEHMAKTLFETQGGGCLYVLGGEGLPSYQLEDGFQIHRFSQPMSNYLERALAFGNQLTQLLTENARVSNKASSADLKICHFRDPWSALAILNFKQSTGAAFCTLYEVNGLPSIELPYAYPHIAPETLSKIRHQEQLCLEEVDKIVVPSKTIKENLIKRNISPDKIAVIPNGADIPAANLPRPSNAPSRYLIYFGALQQWQGIDDLLRALPLLADIENLELVVCAAKHNRIAKSYQKLCSKLGIDNKVHWKFALDKTELQCWVTHAELSVAPLTDCERNINQGCCPLKILESLAAGTPVVATDLPVVRELMRDGNHGRLIRANRPTDIARATRLLLDAPLKREAMAKKCVERVTNHFSWESATTQLQTLYREMITE